MTGNHEQLKVDIAVIDQRQQDMDKRQENFMRQLYKTTDEINRNIAKTWNEINSIHGHITRCREELRNEMDRDFMTKAEGEQLRGSIKEINTKIYMTGLGIVLALSLVQIGITIYGGS